MSSSERADVSTGTPADAPGRGDDRDDQIPCAPLSEWIVAAVSTMLVLAMLGYTVAEALRRPKGPAVVTVTADSVVRKAAGHTVMFTLRNEGGETAATVHVRGALMSEGVPVEESEVVFDYVPVGSHRAGALQFRRDPASHALVMRVTGFSDP